MNITLYYVPGINETDTPVFDTKANQELFFAECERKDIASGFYPPFFQNTITLSTADFNLTTTVFNYLSLEYDGKKFYYFVQSKSYVAEDLTEISIYMDVIQTYMFDITWVYSHIDRLSIKRWDTGGLINREYIRENYSSGLFDKVQVRNVYNSDYNQWVFIACESDDSENIDYAMLDCFSDNNYHLPFKYKKYGTLLFSPMNDGTWTKTTHTYSGGSWTTSTSTENLNNNVFCREALQRANVYDAFVIPFNPFADSYFTITSSDTFTSDLWYNTFDPTYPSDGLIVIQGTSTAGNFLKMSDKCKFKLYTGTVSLGFSRNSALDAPFDWHYVPALVDNSYILADFGNTRERSCYPLQVMNVSSLRYSYWADVTTGTIYFNLIPYVFNLLFTDNTYSTIKSTDVNLGLTIRTDAWNEYIARNKATLAGAIIQSAKTSVGANINTRADTGSRGADSVASSWTPRRNIKGQFQKARPLTTTMHKTSSDYSSQNKGVSTSANVTANPSDLVDYGINAVNLLTTPDTIKIKGEYEADALGANALIYSQVVTCSNIEEVAYIYESVGYKVSINTDENLLQIQNRYYYDYIQCDEMNIHVTDIDTQEAIISRFRDGLRLWHTTDGVLNTQTVEGVTLEMGQVCIYDNVEV